MGEIVHFLSVFSAYSRCLNIMKIGPKQKYDFSIDTFNLKGPQWVNLNKKRNQLICLEPGLNKIPVY